MLPISEPLMGMLNNQVGHELGNKNAYMHMASWANTKGMRNIAKFFKSQADGEQGHADLISKLIDEANGQLSIPDIPKKPSNFSDCEEVARQFVEIEALTTDALEEIYFSAESEKAIGVSNLIQGLLQEQVEEEGLSDRFSRVVSLANGNLLLLDLMF